MIKTSAPTRPGATWYAYVYVYVYVNVRVDVDVYMHAYVYTICMCVCVCVCVYIYIYTHMKKYTIIPTGIFGVLCGFVQYHSWQELWSL